MALKQVHQISLWENDKVAPILAGIRLAPGSAEYEEVSLQPTSSPSKEHCAIGLPMFQRSSPTTKMEMRCSYCQTTFSHRQEQVDHYRLDWHRRNLHRAMQGKSSLNEEQFQNESSDVSSISGSEDDLSEDEDGNNDEAVKDNEETTPVLRRQARIFFVNADGLVISLFRNILFSAKCEINGEQDVVQRVLAAPHRQSWAIILLGGGHFAAAVFKANEVVIHKTFHNYTVRAKQGGNQSSKDNQSATAHPKSSGSSLRRYNEQSQRQHIQELMESWKPHLNKCDLIFNHAKHHNRNTLFGGKNPILDSKDERLRNIPFATKRATFSEVKRVFGLLSEILVHGTEEEFRTMVKNSLVGEVKPNVKKKKETTVKKAEKKPKSARNRSPNDLPSSHSERESEGDDDIELVTSLCTLSTSELGGRDCSLKSPRKKKITGNKAAENKIMNDKSKRSTTSNKRINEGCHHKSRVWDVIYTACKTGSVEHLKTALKIPPLDEPQGDILPDDIMESIKCTEIPSNLSCITLGRKDKTLLHVAAENDQKDIVWWLLEHGCDPSVADTDKIVPFDCASYKETRNEFRRFMAQYPDKYDYKKAKVPSALTPEQEAQQAAKLAQRRKAQRQAKLERQKEKKKKAKEEMQEEEEKKRFLALSDRDKRALAAERRILEQQVKAGVQNTCLLRCFMCATDITGLVPFEYNGNKFCSTKCVRDHRLKKS
ncbi:tRNA endonuclease ANKZF1 isoform X2 [Procambarus clarkii]|uniref:tRNA endonuclease ANKZF1 isoform X2 n=1 Tax=Procambarus clarkii TaxID=6728 RepID=UPI001E672EA3|nr:ankyrin repeat and zinc finger domain-containing protein 1-like isoform X2 [Procambarus clarkii]